jgi:hypothetical protein
LLTHEALDLLCSPSPHPQHLPGPELSPLERFLGCVYMRRQLQRFIQNEDCVCIPVLSSDFSSTSLHLVNVYSTLLFAFVW